MQSSGLRSGTQDALGRVVTAVASPLGRVLAWGADGVGGFFEAIRTAPSSAKRLQDMEQLQQVATLYQETLNAKDEEIENLKELMELPSLGKEKVFAPVWGYFPHENRITIGAGSAQHLIRGAAVVTPEGMVGVVQVVGQQTSQVQLLSSPLPFKIGGMVGTTNPVLGLIHGEGKTRLILEIEDVGAQVHLGDTVYTSGFSERIPRGIPIGKVMQVTDDRDYGMKIVQVFPSAQLGSIHGVAVLR